MIRSDAYSELSTEFRDLKEHYGLTRGSCVKWSPGSGEQRYRAFRSLPNTNQFRRDTLQLLVNKNVKIVCCFINNKMDELREQKRLRRITRAQFKEFIINYNKQALEYVAQRFQRELNGTGEKGQIIIEFNSDSETNSALGQYYRSIHTNGSGGPFFNMRFHNLEDGLLFSHDFCCDGIELADFTTSCLTHALRSHHYGYVDIIKSRIRNRQGQSKGYGIVVYPSASIVADKLINKINS